MPTVEIFGRRYNIKGEHDLETIRSLADYVDRRMRQVAERVGAGDALRVAVLAALNIADDYYQQRRALEQREEAVDRRARELAEQLGAALEASASPGPSRTGDANTERQRDS